MRALLIHEKKTPSAPAGSVGAAAPVTAANGSDSESETSESDDDSPPRVATVAAFHFHALEKEMATHSSVLAWRIPGTGEPGGLPSTGSHRVRHD